MNEMSRKVEMKWRNKGIQSSFIHSFIHNQSIIHSNHSFIQIIHSFIHSFNR